MTSSRSAEPTRPTRRFASALVAVAVLLTSPGSATAQRGINDAYRPPAEGYASQTPPAATDAYGRPYPGTAAGGYGSPAPSYGNAAQPGPGQSYSAQGYSAQGYPAQGYSAQGNSAQGYSGQGYSAQGYSGQAGSSQPYQSQSPAGRSYSDGGYAGSPGQSTGPGQAWREQSREQAYSGPSPAQNSYGQGGYGQSYGAQGYPPNQSGGEYAPGGYGRDGYQQNGSDGARGGSYAGYDRGGYGQPYAAPPPEGSEQRQQPPRYSNSGDNPTRGYYEQGEIVEKGRGFFGAITQGLASAIEHTYRKAGRPNGYILGEDGGGAFFAGLRYGEGTLYTKDAGDHKVFWQGPSLGFDIGGEGSKVMILVYNMRDTGDIFERYAGVEGSTYAVGGVSVQFQKYEDVTLAVIRSGIGLRLGANVGYSKFTRRPTWNPF